MTDAKDLTTEDTPVKDNFNPNEHTSGTLAVERAMKAMALSGEDSPEAEKLRNALLDKDDALFRDDE